MDTEFERNHPRDARGWFTYKQFTEQSGGFDTLSYPPGLGDLNLSPGDTVSFTRQDLGGQFSAFERVDVTAKSNGEGYEAVARTPIDRALRNISSALGVEESEHDAWVGENADQLKSMLRTRYDIQDFSVGNDWRLQAVFVSDKNLYDHCDADDIEAALEATTKARDLIDDLDDDVDYNDKVAEFAQQFRALKLISACEDETVLERDLAQNKRVIQKHGPIMDKESIESMQEQSRAIESRLTALATIRTASAQAA